MKILTTEQRRKADQYTILNEPISSINLMERAATAAFNKIIEKYNNFNNFLIFCGVGNNGGDGLVIARLLFLQKKNVFVYIVDFSPNKTADFLENFEKIKNLSIPFKIITSVNEIDHNFSDFVVIDAILGSGVSRKLEGLLADVVQKINNSSKIATISIDIPSGLFGDTIKQDIISIKADYTITFQFPFLSFMFPETADYVGEFEVVPIGIIEKEETSQFFITSKDVIFRKRQKFSHKGTYGHGLLIAGSYGRMGAAVLAAKGAHHTGIGLLTVHIPSKCVDIIQISSPESLTSIDKNEFYATYIDNLDKFDAIAIGPAIGFAQETVNLIKRLFIEAKNKKFVIDADAITILSQNRNLIELLPPESILTPHPKELSRLIGETKDSIERLEKQKEFSIKYKVYIIQKGAHTAITTPEGHVYFNSTGNPSLAKGGTGDVLTGVILSLLSQNYSPLECCINGVFIHGLAADIAIKRTNQMSLTPSMLIYYLSDAINNCSII